MIHPGKITADLGKCLLRSLDKIVLISVRDSRFCKRSVSFDFLARRKVGNTNLPLIVLRKEPLGSHYDTEINITITQNNIQSDL